jgi:tether containing UBX domain for GLUT4
MCDTPQTSSSSGIVTPSMVEPAGFKVYKPPESTRGYPCASAYNCYILHSLGGYEVGELPDSYFAPTAVDLKAAQNALTGRTQALVNAPLQLRATREALEKAKRDRWPNVCCLSFLHNLSDLTLSQTTIRIRFSDQTQLEKVFLSSDKIRSVYAFVRSSLRDDVKPIKFVLCL